MYGGLHVDLTERIIGCAMEVHRQLGPGLLESVYEKALCCELSMVPVSFERQFSVPMYYKGELLSEYRIDLFVESSVLVEVKSIKRIEPIHEAQVLTYLRVAGIRVGLLLNFNEVVLKHGIRRISL